MPGWRAVLGVLAAIAAVLVFSAFGATSVGLKPYDAGVMASWVQAIGSIAAIGAAGYFPLHHARVLAIKAEQRRLAQIRFIGDFLAQLTGELIECVNDPARARGFAMFGDMHSWEELKGLGATIPIFELDTHSAIRHSIALRKAIAEAFVFAEALHDGDPTNIEDVFQGEDDEVITTLNGVMIVALAAQSPER